LTISQVPAIAYGGPETSPDDPSPESHKLAESGVLIQFIADISDQPLLPADPVKRAKARFFIETITPKISSAHYGALYRGEAPVAILEAVELLQKLLPAEGYAVGEWSIADAAITPFLARADVALKNDIGKYEAGKGKAAWEILTQDAKYERFRKYFAEVTSRASFQETFYPVFIYFAHLFVSNGFLFLSCRM